MIGVFGQAADAAGPLAAVRRENGCPSDWPEENHTWNNDRRRTFGAQASAMHKLEAARLQHQAHKRQQDPRIVRGGPHNQIDAIW